MIELKGRYNKDCKIFADDIEESAYSLIQNILDEKATKDVPVRIMPDVHAGVGIVIGFTSPMTKFVNPDWVGCDIGCFHGDTEVKTIINGDRLSDEIPFPRKGLIKFSDLYEKFKSGDEIEVFSRDDTTNYGNIHHSKVKNIWITKYVTELLCLEFPGFSDNQYKPIIVKCTPDHRFLLIGGKYKEAKDLVEGVDEIQAFFRSPIDVFRGSTTLTSKKIIQYDEPIPVYDLEVDGEFHNFSITELNISVHNCGVETHELSLSDDINLELIDSQIRDVVPMGMNLRSKSILNEKEFIKKFKRNVSSFHTKYTEHTGINYELPIINEKYITSTLKRLHMEPEVFYKSIGTLGGGNHFIELGKDLNNKLWLTIHSGSRNLGIKVWKYHTNQAKNQRDSNDPEYSRELEKIKNTTSDRSQIPKLIEELKDRLEMGVNKKFLRGEYLFNYLIDMIFAQTYAEFNRDAMRLEICKKLHCVVMDSIKSIHNYIDFDDFIIRKGAIRSYEGEQVVIPFSMKDGLIIGEGKSNEDFNFSASHGAGRVLARGKAKDQLSMEEFTEQMKDTLHQ